MDQETWLNNQNGKSWVSAKNPSTSPVVLSWKKRTFSLHHSQGLREDHWKLNDWKLIILTTKDNWNWRKSPKDQRKKCFTFKNSKTVYDFEYLEFTPTIIEPIIRHNYFLNCFKNTRLFSNFKILQKKKSCCIAIKIKLCISNKISFILVSWHIKSFNITFKVCSLFLRN